LEKCEAWKEEVEEEQLKAICDEQAVCKLNLAKAKLKTLDSTLDFKHTHKKKILFCSQNIFFLFYFCFEIAKFINNQVSAQDEQRPVRELHNIGAVYKQNTQIKTPKQTSPNQNPSPIPNQKGAPQIPDY
jgi:ABC-type cobalamin/Fe3+-siderophores transport system ATPase subunit